MQTRQNSVVHMHFLDKDMRRKYCSKEKQTVPCCLQIGGFLQMLSFTPVSEEEERKRKEQKSKQAVQTAFFLSSLKNQNSQTETIHPSLQVVATTSLLISTCFKHCGLPGCPSLTSLLTEYILIWFLTHQFVQKVEIKIKDKNLRLTPRIQQAYVNTSTMLI